jgi:nicotinate phosphoribosyltransferase
MIATKASRLAYIEGKHKIIEFGSRRAHGPEAGALAGRAAYIGGCAGTSNAYCGYKFDIPTFGTMAHSWVMAFDSEKESFEKYLKVFPDSTVLLVDTYDTIEGVKKAVQISPKINGVRLDSGDLYTLSVESRKILDDAGLTDAIILASGDLNEYKVKELVDKGAPIDVFGVGTDLATSADAPNVGGVYKLVEVEKNHILIPKAKFSTKKATYPGKKQVWRILNDDNKLVKDIVAHETEDSFDNAMPLLIHTVKNGELLTPKIPLSKIKELCLNNLLHLDKNAFGLECTPVCKVEISQKLKNSKIEY